MWRTNLKILALVAAMLGVFMLVANSIPQLQSELPQAVELSGDVTPEQLVAAGEEIFNGAGGCTTCHGLGTRAPNLLTDEAGAGPIGARCGNRRPGMSCKDYLLESLTEPGAFVVEGYQPIMQDLRRTLPMDQVWAVIAYLESQGGTVDVTADDVGSAQRETGAAPAPAPGGVAPATASLDPREIMNANLCLGCHMLRGQGAAVGPPFDGIGARLTRDQIREAILDPGATLASGYEAMAGVMPPTFGQQVSAAQLEAVVNFLASQR
jgi:mono/diheme cytochrome c family protein